MPEFLNQVEAARQAQRHLFIWDKQGVCAQLAQYSGSVVHDFKLEQERIVSGVKTLEEVLEKLRKMLVVCGRSGRSLMIDLGQT